MFHLDKTIRVYLKLSFLSLPFSHTFFLSLSYTRICHMFIASAPKSKVRYFAPINVGSGYRPLELLVNYNASYIFPLSRNKWSDNTNVTKSFHSHILHRRFAHSFTGRPKLAEGVQIWRAPSIVKDGHLDVENDEGIGQLRVFGW